MAPCDQTYRFPLQFFPPGVIKAAKRYRFDEELRDDPVEYQKIYEELKVKAALLVIVCIFVPLAPFRCHYSARTPHTLRFVLWLTTMTILWCLQIHSALGSSEQSSLQQGMLIITRRTPLNTWYPWRAFTDRFSRRGFINQFFSIRQPGITVTANVAQLLAFPTGKLLEAILPSRQFTTFGYTWSLNPGKFNPKEHTVITIMANVGFSTPYTANVRLIISPAQSSV